MRGEKQHEGRRRPIHCECQPRDAGHSVDAGPAGDEERRIQSNVQSLKLWPACCEARCARREA